MYLTPGGVSACLYHNFLFFFTKLMVLEADEIKDAGVGSFAARLW
jgi:hypothetical protein